MQYKKFLGKHSVFYSLRNKEAGVKETTRNHRHSVFVVNMLSFGIRVACDGDMKRKPVKKWLWEVLMVPCFYFALHATLQIARLRPALRILSMKPARRKLNEIPESLKSSEIQLSLRPYPAIPHFFLLSVIFAFKLGSSCTCALSGHLEIDSFISFFFFFTIWKNSRGFSTVLHIGRICKHTAECLGLCSVFLLIFCSCMIWIASPPADMNPLLAVNADPSDA